VPSFTYAGHSPGLYPTLRDAYGVLAGLVEPGDVLEFSAAPDADWVPYEAGAGAQGERGGIESEPDPADAGGAGLFLGAGQQDDDTAGEPGSEEI
jgi:hypothetical protein